MTTYGTTELMGDTRPRVYKTDGVKKRKTIVYPEVFYNHFHFRDAVDANNGMWMFSLAMEETWKTVRWPNRDFQFLLAVTKTNCQLPLFHMYGTPEQSQQDFRGFFSKVPIENKILEGGSDVRMIPRGRMSDRQYALVSLEKNCTFNRTGNIVICNTDYIQLKCERGMRCVCTYCMCVPGTMLCGSCFVDHVNNS